MKTSQPPLNWLLNLPSSHWSLSFSVTRNEQIRREWTVWGGGKGSHWMSEAVIDGEKRWASCQKDHDESTSTSMNCVSEGEGGFNWMNGQPFRRACESLLIETWAACQLQQTCKQGWEAWENCAKSCTRTATNVHRSSTAWAYKENWSLSLRNLYSKRERSKERKQLVVSQTKEGIQYKREGWRRGDGRRGTGKEMANSSSER